MSSLPDMYVSGGTIFNPSQILLCPSFDWVLSKLKTSENNARPQRKQNFPQCDWLQVDPFHAKVYDFTLSHFVLSQNREDIYSSVKCFTGKKLKAYSCYKLNRMLVVTSGTVKSELVT